LIIHNDKLSIHNEQLTIIDTLHYFRQATGSRKRGRIDSADSMLSIRNEVLWRIYLVAGFVMLVAVLIIFRMYTLAVVEQDKWIDKGKKRFLEWGDVHADRGNILDINGTLLATSLPFYDVYFDPKDPNITNEAFLANADSLALCLATHVNTEYTPGAYRVWLDQIRAQPDNTPGGRYIKIAENVDYQKLKLIKQFPLFRLGKTKGGLIVEQRAKRDRPFNILAQRTIGYVREGSQPVGLEGRFDRQLGGKIGKQLLVKVPGEYYVPVHDLAAIEPQAGNDLVTTIDVNIQDAAQTALMNCVKKHDADHGCAIVMEVKTGAIRAMANLGRSQEGWWETYNYAVGERVEPGSMFKLASFMALLEDGYIKSFDQKVPVYKGKIKYYKEELVDDKEHGFDTMTTRQVFALSSNVGTSKLITDAYGPNNRAGEYLERLEDFGLFLPSEVEVEGEELPYIKSPKKKEDDWSGTTLPWMSIGYELMLTPLQVLQFYNAVANDGRMMKPYLVDHFEHNGEVLDQAYPKVMKRSIASKHTIDAAKQLLESVVEEGTASRLKTSSYRFAGKTGTTQLNYHKFKIKNGLRYQASFCGYFPANDPKYSVIVVISEPKVAGFHGAEVAAPVFREIADKVVAMRADMQIAFNSTPSANLTASQLPSNHSGRKTEIKDALKWLNMDWEENAQSEWVALHAKSDSLLMTNRNLSDKQVPSVVGMGLKDAIFLLENAGLRVRVQGVGKVRQQSVAAGSARAGQTITLVLG
jgi:cell division protein FtsI (penicillin-binding protein 3)